MLLSTALSARTTNDLRNRGERGWRPTPGGPRSARPRLEMLENRTLLSTWVVTDNSDNLNDPGSLLYAVQNAPSGSIITFASNVTGTINIPNIYNSLASPLGISQNLDIQGPGANNLTISGNGWTNVFETGPNATATIAGLTIADGVNVAGSGGGGGIWNEGTLTVTNCTLLDNSATVGEGGGIFNQGTLTVTNSTLSGNSATSGYGSAIDNAGTLTVTNSTLSGNFGPERRRRRHRERWHADGHKLHSLGQLGRIRRRHREHWHADGHKLHPLGQLGPARTRRRNREHWHADGHKLHPLGQLGPARTRRRNLG